MKELRQAETQEFLRELTELSRRYKLGLVGPVTLFVMEEDDFDRAYRCGDEDRIEFV
jgi:hypothetical protein